MPRSPTAAGPLVLADSRAPATDRPELALLFVHLPSSPAERQPAARSDKEWVRACGCAFAVDRAETPSERLRRQNCGCSPPARPDELPPRGRRGPVLLPDASGGPEPVRAGLQ